MIAAKRTVTAGVMVSCLVAGAPIQASAASASVSVGIHFEVAPADLFRTKSLEPTMVQSCNVLKARIEGAWAGKPRPPALRCRSARAMPLIVTGESNGTLIVRP